MSATLDNDMQAITGLSRTNPRITFRKTVVMQSCAKSYKDTVGKRPICADCSGIPPSPQMICGSRMSF
jgi:hypothetical protein